MSLEDTFGDIYKNQKWGDGSHQNPLSGNGSTKSNARPYVKFVYNFISQNEIRSVVDFGHGDWQMWDENSFQNVDYLGVDVAKDFSKKIQEKFGNAKRRFESHNIEVKSLPHADLLISKDVLQHLPISTINTFFKQMKIFKYVIICNDIYVKQSSFYELIDIVLIRQRLRSIFKLKSLKLSKLGINNCEILAGEFTGVDLESPPFSEILKSFEILSIKDYNGPKRFGIKKRIYLLSKK